MEKVIQKIMHHLSHMDYIVASSLRLLRATQEGDVDLVSSESDNRERLINILEQLQLQTNSFLEAQEIRKYSAELTPVLKCWAQDMNVFLEKINQIDQILIENLGTLREQTIQDISMVYKKKQQFKGYNLNSVKK